MNEKLTEQYYRCDFETSKLLKEAGFDEKCTAHYDISDGYYWGIATNSNHNYFERKCSAPLISVAKEWLNEKGYDVQTTLHHEDKSAEKYFMLRLRLNNQIILFDAWYLHKDVTQKDFDLNFIQTCCKHIIENK